MAASSVYRADDILTDAKLRAFYPTSGGVLSDGDIISLANDELLGIMTAKEMAAVQGHLAVETTIPFVTGQARYDLPYRAAGGKVRYVVKVDANSNRQNIRFGRPERFAFYNQTQRGDPTNAWFEDGRIVVFQVPNDATNSLLLGIYLRPGRLQKAANATYVTAAAAAGATTFTVSAVPNNTSGIGGNLNGATSVDVISSLPPFQVKAYDLTVSAISTGNTTITVTASGGLPYALAVNDWMTVPGESVVPQLPAEAHPLLAARTARRVLSARGDAQNIQIVSADIKDLEDQIYEYLSNRNEFQIDGLANNELLAGGKSRFGFGLGGF